MLREDGERFLPWMADPVINYEHLHRYRAIAPLCVGRRVIDLASGEGYGSAMLAGSARRVVGLELDGEAVAHARRAYPLPAVTFVQGSMTAAPFGRERFDVVVCFEALEHVGEQDRLCAEAARMLAPGGCFVVSTPNRAVYSDVSGYENPFHVKELDLDEFRGLLGRHFRHLEVLGQHIYPVSSIFALAGDPSSAPEYVIAREPGDARYAFVAPARKAPRYFIAIATADSAPAGAGLALASILLDASEQLFELQRRSEGAVVELTRHLGVREAQVLDLERRLADLQGELGRAVTARAELADRAAELERHLRSRAAQAEELDGLLRQRGLEVQELAKAADRLREQIAAMEATLAWRIQRKARAGLGRLGRLGRRGSD